MLRRPAITRSHAIAGPSFALAILVGAATAVADDGLYYGVSGFAALYDVDYQKAVDSRHPSNRSTNAGLILYARDSTDDFTWDAGLLIGYRLGLGPLDFEVEGDFVKHSGEASGRLPGAGASPERNLLGEVWPENWSLAKDRSYGIRASLGAPLPIVGADLSAFVGIRRVEADFKTSYTGCLTPEGCPPGELVAGRERHDEDFDAWIAGVAIEKSFGSLGLRGEVRYTDHGNSKRTVPFEEVAVTVPVDLESGEIGVGVSLVWRP